MAFHKLPTKKEFKAAFGTGVFSNKLPEGPVRRMGHLLAELETHRGNQNGPAHEHLTMLWHLHEHCKYAVNHLHKSGVKKKVHSRFMTIEDLDNIVWREMQRITGMRNRTGLQELFSQNLIGLEAVNLHAEEDAREIQSGTMARLQTDVARTQFKLAFRNGVAHTWNFNGAVKGSLEPYDTDKQANSNGGQHALEHGGAMFVMDTQGRIYANARFENFLNFKHSSFMDGANVLAAGTIRAENGRIKWVSAKSGHYQPTVRHMVSFLERLLTYKVDLSQVTFYRMREGREFHEPGSFHRGDFEGCPALELLRKRAFPGIAPTKMRITSQDLQQAAPPAQQNPAWQGQKGSIFVDT